MNNPITEGAVFRQKDIRFGKMLPLAKYRALVCYTDPSFKDSTKNDCKATMLVGLTHEGYFHVLKAYCDQTSVKAMIQWHYDIHTACRDVPVHFYMEANFIQDLILDEFKKAGAEVGWQIPIRGDARKKPDKFARTEALQPFFERGFILLNEAEKKHPGMIRLVEQLLMFERGSRAHDDAPDALEGAISILNLHHKTVNNRYVAQPRTSWRW
jgi:predicted phage terminase large subunit-like protein